jgi:hypothetical protein
MCGLWMSVYSTTESHRAESIAVNFLPLYADVAGRVRVGATLSCLFTSGFKGLAVRKRGRTAIAELTSDVYFYKLLTYSSLQYTQ